MAWTSLWRTEGKSRAALDLPGALAKLPWIGKGQSRQQTEAEYSGGLFPNRASGDMKRKNGLRRNLRTCTKDFWPGEANSRLNVNPGTALSFLNAAYGKRQMALLTYGKSRAAKNSCADRRSRLPARRLLIKKQTSCLSWIGAGRQQVADCIHTSTPA